MLEATSPDRQTGSVFVGRRRELDELRAGLADSCTGRGRLFMLTGEPGIGKTRTADELAAHARGRGARVLWGRCWEGDGAPVFWPWVQAVRSYANDCEPAVLCAEMGAGASDIAQVVPEVLERLPHLPRPPALEPAQARFRLFDSVSSFLKNAARRRPLVLILDDLHWADVPSLLLLHFVARDLRDAPLLVVATYRDVEVTRDHPLSEAIGALARESQHIVLHGLERDDVARFVESATGVTPSASLVTAVCEKTEGNPFYLSEIVRLLDSDGSLGHPDEPATWHLSIPPGVRETIRRRLGRLSAASNRILTIAAVIGRDFGLDVIEAVGSMQDLPDHGSAGSAGASGRLLEALDEAVATRLVEAVPRSIGRYRFVHALVRETLYEELTTTRRAQLHRALGETLERFHSAVTLEPHPSMSWPRVPSTSPPRAESRGSGQRLAELAYHFFEAARVGSEVRKAIDYAQRAGEQATAQLAYEEAANHYQRALDAVELQRPADEHKRCELMLALGEAHMHVAEAGMKGCDTAPARETLQRAAALAQRLGAAELLTRAALAFGGTEVLATRTGLLDSALVRLLEDALAALAGRDSSSHVRVLSRLVKALYWSSATERRATLSEQALQMARRLGDPLTMAYALYSRRWGLRVPEELEARLAAADEMVRCADAAGNSELSLAGRAWLIVELTETGDVARVDQEIEAYARLAAELRVRSYQWGVLIYRAMRAIMSGQFEEGERLTQETLSMAHGPYATDAVQAVGTQLAIIRTEQGRLAELEPVLRSFVDQYPTLLNWRAGLALFCCELGRVEDARQELERLAAHDFADLPRDSNWINTLTLLAETCAALGDTRRAATLYALLLPCARRTMVIGYVSGCWGSVARWLGVLATTLSRWDEAVAHFELALAINGQMGARPWVAHTQYEYARMLLASGAAVPGGGRPDGREKAFGLLRDACATFTELGMKSRLDRATALLSGQGDRVREAGALAPSPVSRSPAGSGRNTFREDGGYWSVVYEESAVRLKSNKGLQYVAHLLRNPGREFHVLDLIAVTEGQPADPREGLYAGMSKAQLEEEHLSAHRRVGEALQPDAQARIEYRHRLEGLKNELEEAERFNDSSRAAAIRQEVDAITTELGRLYGLGGRAQRSNEPIERARKAVGNRIRDALAQVRRGHPPLWRHLVNAIHTGTFCSYAPEQPTLWEL